MGKIDFSSLPLKIKNVINGLNYYQDTTGKSGAEVYIFDDYVLKISSLSFVSKTLLVMFANFAFTKSFSACACVSPLEVM